MLNVLIDIYISSKESVFVASNLPFQDLCYSPGPAVNQLLGHIYFYTINLKFCLSTHNFRMEVKSGAFSGHGLKNVMFCSLSHVGVTFMVSSIMQDTLLFVTKPFLDGWKKLLLLPLFEPTFNPSHEWLKLT